MPTTLAVATSEYYVAAANFFIDIEINFSDVVVAMMVVVMMMEVMVRVMMISSLGASKQDIKVAVQRGSDINIVYHCSHTTSSLYYL